MSLKSSLLKILFSSGEIRVGICLTIIDGFLYFSCF